MEAVSSPKHAPSAFGTSSCRNAIHDDIRFAFFIMYVVPERGYVGIIFV